MSRLAGTGARGLAAWVLAGAALSQGCSPSLYPLTVAPPMYEAKDATRRGLTHPFEGDRWRMTEGVTVAFECHDGSNHGPCDPFKVTSDDPAIARVHIAYLARRSWSYGDPVSSFVLVGVKPGETKIRASSGSWTEVVTVTVEAAKQVETAKQRAVN